MKIKDTKIINMLKRHIENNLKEYVIIIIIFIIGIFLGVFFVNNISETQNTEVGTYLNNFINKMKNIESVNNIGVLKTSISQNIILGLAIWFFGTTVIRNSYCIWNNFI